MSDLNSFSNVKTNFNVSPYFDDWVKEKGFQRVLFKPSVAVQARELTQMQTIISDQIAQLADFNLKEGSIIKGGEIVINTSFVNGTAERIEIPLSSPLYEKIKTYIDNPAVGKTPFINNKLIYEERNVNNVTVKKIVFRIVDLIEPTTSLDNFTIVGVYETASDSKFTTVDSYQIQSQTVQDYYNFSFLDNTNSINSIFPSISSESVTFTDVGLTSYATITEGIFYAKGYFIYFPQQTVLLDKKTNKPTCKIGIQLYEEILDASEDDSLFDNAIGSPNENAPGADRFKISAQFESKKIDTSSPAGVDYLYGALENNTYNDFFEITRILDGNVVNTAAEDILGDIKDIIAQKTYDINGDFEVTPFKVEVKEDLKPETREENEKFYSMVVSRGEAYVHGYEIHKKGETLLDIEASRNIQENNTFNTGDSYRTYIEAKIASEFSATASISDFLATINDSDVLNLYTNNSLTTKIGSVRIRDFGISGSSYYLYVYSVDVEPDQSLSSATVITKEINSIDTVVFGIVGEEVLRFPNVGHIVYPLKEKRINSINDIEYTTRQFLSSSVDSNKVTITLSASSDFFVAQTVSESELPKFKNDFYVFRLNGSAVEKLSYTTLKFTTTSLEITLSGSIPDQTAVMVGIKAQRSINTFSNKTLTNYTQSSTITAEIPANQVIVLDKKDVYKVTEVRHTAIDGTDPTTIENFTFTDGQTDNYYDFGTVQISEAIPIDRILHIDIEYFEHTGTGPFVAQSYRDDQRYKTFYTTSSGEFLDLTDCIDFRRKIGDSITPLANTTAVRIEATYSSYLARYDKLFLNKEGNFQILKGNPAKNPLLPPDPTNGITLYSFYVEPYTISKFEISSRKYDYKRYRMKDISVLERRIENLETRYNFSSSQEKVRSDNSGVAVSGILVDNFTDPRSIDFSDVENNCTIDLDTNTLKPYYETYNYKFKSKNTTSGYEKNGDIISLDQSTPKVYIESASGSSPNSIGKPTVITPSKNGFVKLYPEIEVWKDDSKISYMTNTADRIGKAYKDLTRSQTKNTEILSVTWPTTVKNIVREDAESSSLLNDFGTIEYNENIIEYLPQSFVVCKAINLLPNYKLTAKFSTNDVHILFPAITVMAPLSSEDYDRLDVENYQFPWVLKISIGGADYRFKVVHKEPGSVSKLYLLHEGLFSTDTSSEDKKQDRLEYYPNLALLSQGIITISDGTNSLDISTYSDFVVPETLNDYKTDSEGRFFGGFCIDENISNISERFEISVDDTKAYADYYSLLNIQKEITEENITRKYIESTLLNPIRQIFTVDRQDNRHGIFVDSIDLNLSKLPSDAEKTISVALSKVQKEIDFEKILPFSIVHKKATEATTVGYTRFSFDSPVYLEPGEYTISILSNSEGFEIQAGISNEPLFSVTDNSPIIDCRINMKEFNNTLNNYTLGIFNPSDTAQDLSLLNLNGTFISGLNTTTGPRFFLEDTEIIPNKNLIKKQNTQIDSSTDLILSMSTEDNKVSPIVDLQSLNLIGVKYNTNLTYTSKPITIQKDLTSNSVNISLSLYVPLQTLTIKCYVKVDTVYALTDQNNQWIEATIDRFSSITRSTNDSDFKDLLYVFEGTEIFNTFKVKVEISGYPHYDIPVINQLSAVSFMDS